MEEYPQARIEVFDSKTNCMAMGIQVIEAAIAAKAGKKMEDVIETARCIREKIRFYFVPASLEYLIKGGRIGGASALIGNLLQIRPILYVNDGMTDVMGRIRGTRKAINHMLSILNDDAKNYGLRHLMVHHIHDPKQGQELAERLAAQYNRIVPSLPVGPVIGAHVGPGTVGIVYCTNK
jgi:DegV family protein with EDD domain